jgi:hypothetical protein
MVLPLTQQPNAVNTAGYSGGKKPHQGEYNMRALIVDAFAPRPVQLAGIVIFTILGQYVRHGVVGLALGALAHAALWVWSHATSASVAR